MFVEKYLKVDGISTLTYEFAPMSRRLNAGPVTSNTPVRRV